MAKSQEVYSCFYQFAAVKARHHHQNTSLIITPTHIFRVIVIVYILYMIYDIGPILHIKLISAAASLVTWDLEIEIEMCYFGSDAAAFLSDIREMENKVLKPNELP